MLKQREDGLYIIDYCLQLEIENSATVDIS